MFAIAPTDSNWFNFLRNNNVTDVVNFWTPTPWRINKLSQGDHFYFMRKSPIRQIGGGGKFANYSEITISQAWEKYGLGNGCENESDLAHKIGRYAQPDSRVIGCIELKEVKFLREPEYIDPAHHNIVFSRYIVKLKYFREGEDPFNNLVFS